MSEYQVLARKYRPQTFSDVIGQEAIVQTLKNAIAAKRVAHAYIFSGSRGTGKTTLARILAKALNCQALHDNFEPCNACKSCLEITSGASMDILEIDGASHRGIDDIRLIAESVGYSPATGKFKIYIIDEVHMLTKEAFNALLKTLEEPPANVKFFFATTEVHKVPQTILSRCQRFNLKRIPNQLIVQKLRKIADDLQLTVDNDSLTRIAQYAEGGLRDAESLFDQIISFSAGNVTDAIVQDVLGVMSRQCFFTLDQAVQESNLKVAFSIAQDVFYHGKDVTHFLEDLQDHYRSLLLVKLSCEHMLGDIDAQMKEALKKSSAMYTQEQCLTILEYISQAQQSIKSAVSQQVHLENLLLNIIRIRLRLPIEYISRRLLELEENIRNSLGETQEAPQGAGNAPLTQEYTTQKIEQKPQAIVQPKLQPSAQSATKNQTEVQEHVEQSKQALLPSSQPARNANAQRPEAMEISQAVKSSNLNKKQDLASLTPTGDVRTEKSATIKNAESLPKETPQASHFAALPSAPQSLSKEAPQQNIPVDDMQKKARNDTLLQFAAVELKGSIQRKQSPDTRRK